MIGAGLHRYRQDARYCVIDTETESLNQAFARPWQVAWAIADNKVMQPVKVAYIRWPNLDVSPDAAMLTRFDPKVWDAQARDPREVLDELETDLYREDTEVVWQNGLGYDTSILRTWRRLLGRPPDWSFLYRSIELAALSKALKKQWVPDISSPEAWLAWQYKAVHWIEKGLKFKLELCGQEEKIEHDYRTLHDAASDIALTYKVFQRRLTQVEF